MGSLNILGVTTTGKAIHEYMNDSTHDKYHKNFTSQDHREAMTLLEKKAVEAFGKGNKKQFAYYRTQANTHIRPYNLKD